MRAVFSIVGLLVVLATVGLLVKKQLGTQVASPPAAGMPAAGGATPQEQSRQVQQQVKQSVENMMQQPRPLPDDK
jgi:uncharacterized membrane protein